MRSQYCGNLNASHINQEVTLCGWVESRRDHGGVIFIDLRDREGIVQVVFDPDAKDNFALADKVRGEYVLQVSGKVRARAAATVNPNMATGEIEVYGTALTILNEAKTIPFPLDGYTSVGEETRLKYRFLDLRRSEMQKNLRFRSQVTSAIRNYLDRNGFLDVETPILTRATPEGARDYLVPSRTHDGKFFALPQSPQLFKQLLMVAGFDRYYQIAKCFRDEDLRADRQPEFTQIDIEASFVQREDIYTLIEGMLKELWKEILGIEIQTPFLRLTYQEAMNRFGSDKPDLRYPFELEDFSEAFRNSAFKVFQSVIASGGVVKAINIKGLADITQGELKALEDTAKSLGAKGLAFIKVENGEWKSPILKFFSDAEKQQLQETLHMEDGDIVFFAASDWQTACTILGRIRLDSVALLKKRSILTVSPDDYQFLWVVDFPLMLRDEETGKYAAAHHPFTAPLDEDIPLLDSDPKSARSKAYDCVLNGNEIGGGSIRIHEMSTQKKIFENVLAIPEDIVESRFGYMLEAFKYGAPPHGGIALGFDRLITILTGKDVIRDVIAFPKTQKGQDLMAKCPGPVEPKQLRDLRIQTSK